MAEAKQLTVVYEHPHWFTPLFNELTKRGIDFAKVDVSQQWFDPSLLHPKHDVVFNRISPSSWTRGRGHLIASATTWLQELQSRGVEVINGAETFQLEISKAEQIDLLARAEARAPRTRVVSTLTDLLQASTELVFPVVVKPNVGGSGAGIRLFRDREALADAVAERTIEQPLGDLLLLQEYHRPAERSIVRVETLDAKYLYGIRIHLEDDAGFDLCPADVCKTTDGDALSSAACPVGAQKSGLSVEAYEPPRHVIETVERIARESSLDVGGIEYLESARDGEIYYYDVNALSNFVADPMRVIGFDPTSRLVDSIEQRLGVPTLAAAGGAR